ncbi:hypothetical protein [Streptomyces sp. TS71-3]|uniref:hypothetical protein n=1 Tax=Streptomyces sp. TS71-3 TaxID=2733862 RepID=UPI001B1D6B43|nr:hypothetical protein [Streptomyces sp. TS71-3]GHJ35459.1 hypothetical protein Sm713_10680 [Streptomyces sp. TS71-3]
MSTTTHDDTATPDAHASPKPHNELTDTQSAVHAHLLALTEEATAAELTVSAGLGRSTISKALAALENKRLAIRIHGGHDGPRRVPDLWRAATTNPPGHGDNDHTEDPGGNRSEYAAETSEEVRNAEPGEGAAPITPDNGTADAGTASAGDERHDGPQQAHTSQESSGSSEQQNPTSDVQTRVSRTSGTRKRLAPGGLRQMVVEHLRAHPEKAFTATGISRAIDKSSGAIANALVTLTKQGIAEQVDERPRTYRLKKSESKS